MEVSIIKKLTQLLEVYVDDFMGFLQAPTEAKLTLQEPFYMVFTLYSRHLAQMMTPTTNPFHLKLQQGDGLWDMQRNS